MAGREVLLYVNKEIIEQLGSEAGAGVGDFLRCIKEGPSWIREHEVCSKAWRLYVDWKQKRDLEYPPYIAYLAFFTLAATVEGDFVPWAYYPRFWTLLGEAGEEGAPPDFYKMGRLWEDLEKWSTEDKNEDLGRFIARIRGGYAHVGRPLSQTLLSDKEREYLPLIFDEAELDPTNSSVLHFSRWILLNYGKNKLEKRTLRLLEPAQDDNIDMTNALVEFVLDELAEWDGSVPDIELPPESKPTPTQSKIPRTGLRICLEELDRVSGRITATLRIKANRPFPDNGLNFEYGGQILSCQETFPPNWSTKLMNINMQPNQPFNATTIDWSYGVTFEDKKNKWRASLKGAPVRLFLQGDRERLHGWIESQHLERNCEFIIACHRSKADDVHRWGNGCCEKFREISSHDLPSGWSLFEGRNARESCEDVGVLTLSTRFYLHLEGGIKTGRGNTYFKFAPPIIVIEGGDGSEIVTLNGRELKRENVSLPRWSLPLDATIDRPLVIEALKRNEPYPLQKRVIKLVEPELSLSFEDAPKRDSIGRIAGVSVPFARGAVVSGVDPSAFGVFPHALPTYLSHRIIFLGSRPGEIVDWPTEVLPEDWKPVWGVVKSGKDRWVVHFCGQSEPTEIAPDPNHALLDVRAVKRWKEAMWVKRKRTKAHLLSEIRTLWEKYKEVAKHAV
ncbi:MAG: hypothetical protein EFT35_10605 [Methanophagales archaeon ANME-1-THS]|nr:MAG: hypothetical protein EFT35_10605 [Methanophagales archaeon ANME-1-THS]